MTEWLARDRVQDLLRAWINRVAAVMSLLALVLVVIIGTRNADRSPDAIPLIRAPDDPFKLQPHDGGGSRSPFLGMEVNRIIGGRSAASLAEEAGQSDGSLSFTYAPPPFELAAEDLSPAEREGTHGRQAEDVAAMIVESLRHASTQVDDNPASAGIRREPEDLATGAPLVQLGDFVSTRLAEGEWRRLRAAHPDLLSGHDWVIESTRSGGTRIVRLRVVGFADREAASKVCTRLAARGVTCVSTIKR